MDPCAVGLRLSIRRRGSETYPDCAPEKEEKKAKGEEGVGEGGEESKEGCEEESRIECGTAAQDVGILNR